MPFESVCPEAELEAALAPRADEQAEERLDFFVKKDGQEYAGTHLIIDLEEARNYRKLAERLGVPAEVAQEIAIRASQRRQLEIDRDQCPHCGKSLD